MKEPFHSATSFKMPATLWNGFRVQTDGLFIYRAPFLDHVIKSELPYMRADLKGYRMSTRAKRYISGELKRTDTEGVNLELRTSTADELREIVREHNLVRDAILARLVILLRSTDALLKWLEVPRYASDRSERGYLEDLPASPLLALEAIRDDPLFYVRHFVRDRHGLGLYRVDLPAVWASCHIEEDFVPGTKANKAFARVMNEIIGDPAPVRAKRSRRPAAGRS